MSVPDSVPAASSGSGPTVGEKGLRSNALGFVSSTVIGVASTAPGYSLAAVLGYVVLEVGFQAPAMWARLYPQRRHGFSRASLSGTSSFPPTMPTLSRKTCGTSVRPARIDDAGRSLTSRVLEERLTCDDFRKFRISAGDFSGRALG